MAEYKLTNSELDRITDSLRGAISTAFEFGGKRIIRLSKFYQITAICNKGYFVITVDIPAVGETLPTTLLRPEDKL